MTVSNRALLTAAAVIGFALPLGAQPPPPAGPISILPAQTAPETGAAPQEPSIDVGDLKAPGVDSIGLVDTAAGGFSAQLWRGTDLELLKVLLPQLPRRSPSPALRRLAKNLLLSPGAAPVAAITDAPAATNETLTASQWLLETRAATLASLGDWVEVQALLDLVPADQMTESLKRLRTEANLVTNHVSDACSQTQAALNATPDPYWQKIQVFCQLDINQSSAASLGLALLREQKIEDPAFFWAADVLGGASAPLPAGFTKLEPLHYAMLRKAAATLPANIADVQAKIADPATLGWLAGLPLADDTAAKGDKTPPATRIARRRALEDARLLLAERAVRAGTLNASVLRAAYRSIDTKNPAPPPLTQIKADDVRGRALLYQSALAQTVPTARAEVVALALDLVRADRGETGPDLTVMGPVYADVIGEMEPTSDLVWFAGTAARALLAAGPEDKAARSKAKGWLDLARNMGRTSREAGQIADGLWPIEAIMTESAASRLPPQAVRGWVGSLPPTTPAAVIAAKQGVMLSLLMAVGEPVAVPDWLSAMNGSPVLDNVVILAPQLWNGLTLAAKGNRAGETAAFALVAVGEDSPARAAMPALQHVIESLRLAGRVDDARALAVEAALVLGL